MEPRTLRASQEALLNVREIAGDALASPDRVRPPLPKIMRMSRTELAYGLKHLQRTQLCHYLRKIASREAVLMIRESAEEAMHLLDTGDEQIARELAVWDAYPHGLYAGVTVIALIAAEREEIKRERDFWRRQSMIGTTLDHPAAYGM